MPINISATKAKRRARPRAETSVCDGTAMLNKARAAAADPHLASPIGMLKAQGLLTERQARAALAYAEVRRGADWALSSPRRTAASARFEVGRGFTGGDETDDVTARRQAVLARFRALEAAIGGTTAVALLDRVCVEHVVPIGREVEALRAVLDRLARELAIGAVL